MFPSQNREWCALRVCSLHFTNETLVFTMNKIFEYESNNTQSFFFFPFVLQLRESWSQNVSVQHVKSITGASSCLSGQFMWRVEIGLTDGFACRAFPSVLLIPVVQSSRVAHQHFPLSWFVVLLPTGVMTTVHVQLIEFNWPTCQQLSQSPFPLGQGEGDDRFFTELNGTEPWLVHYITQLSHVN